MIFKCQNCGGNILYNPDKGTMCCPHCESLDSEDKLVSTEYMTNCANCGAPMEGAIKEHTSATKCPNCGIYTVLDERVEGVYAPDLMLPFKVSKNKAIDLLRAEFKNRIFTPTGFLSRASVDKIEGSYIPFFMYDYATDTNYQGTGTKIRTWTSGDYEYTETSYFNIIRQLQADFSKVPVDASEAMEDGYMDLMEPFDYSGLQDFKDKYMSGFLGEKYNQPENELEPRALTKVGKAIDALISGSISGYATVTQNSKNTASDKQKVNYALLPIWEYIFRYQGVDYKFHVNGQTGKIAGKTPVAKDKVVIFGVTVFGLVSVAALLINLLFAAL